MLVIAVSPEFHFGVANIEYNCYVLANESIVLLETSTVRLDRMLAPLYS